MGELMEMSNKEVERYHALKEVMDKRLKQRQAAVLLKIGERQVRNLLNRIKAYGAKKGISYLKKSEMLLICLPAFEVVLN